MSIRIPLLLVSLLALTACDGQIGGSQNSPPPEVPELPDDEPLVEVDVGETDFPAGRRVTRMTANQFHRSLEVVTGQTWSQYGTFAGALGDPDFVESTTEATEISITFAKFVDDAARETCREAVDVPLESNVIFRDASPSDEPSGAGFARIEANLDYLFLRFLGQEPTEERLAPLRRLVTENADGTVLESPDEDTMKNRWWAACVALATHPDFYSY